MKQYNKSSLKRNFFTNIKKPHVTQRTLAFLRTEDPVRVNDQAKQCGILSSCLLKPQIWNAMEIENMNVFTTLRVRVVGARDAVATVCKQLNLKPQNTMSSV